MNNMPPSQPLMPPTPPKKVPWVAIGVLAAILIIGGGYLLFGKQITTSKVTKLPPLTVTSPVPTAQEDLENELNNIDLDGGAENEFDAIDQDLKQM